VRYNHDQWAYGISESGRKLGLPVGYKEIRDKKNPKRVLARIPINEYGWPVNGPPAEEVAMVPGSPRAPRARRAAARRATAPVPQIRASAARYNNRMATVARLTHPAPGSQSLLTPSVPGRRSYYSSVASRDGRTTSSNLRLNNPAISIGARPVQTSILAAVAPSNMTPSVTIPAVGTLTSSLNIANTATAAPCRPTNFNGPVSKYYSPGLPACTPNQGPTPTAATPPTAVQAMPTMYRR
jgi:hypothetical protein